MSQREFERFLADLNSNRELRAGLERVEGGWKRKSVLNRIVSFAHTKRYEFSFEEADEYLQMKVARLENAQQQQQQQEESGQSADERARLDQRWSLFMVPKPDGACGAPWRALKIDIFDRTAICCSYFEKLPKFDWPTAKKFHRSTGMWNHPFMQRLRVGMRNEREVPFCAFCQGRYGQDKPLREAKHMATNESQRIYQDILEAKAPFQLNESINQLPDDLRTIEVPFPSKTSHPFRDSKHNYRREVRRRGFWGLGKVLHIGGRLRDYAPFLAEAGNELTVLDTRRGQLQGTAFLVRHFGENCRAAKYNPDLDLSGIPAGSFDGAWLDGRLLLECGYDKVLAQLHRVLRPGGYLRVKDAVGIGTVALEMANNTAGNWLDFYRRILSDDHRDEAAFLGQSSLPRALAASGYELDKERPPDCRRVGRAYRDIALLGHSTPLIAIQLSDTAFLARIAGDPDVLRGLEKSVSFSAIAMPRRHQFR